MPSGRLPGVHSIAADLDAFLDEHPDAPMAENPCPAPSCVSMFRQIGRTPCMKFCPVQCLDGEVGEVEWRRMTDPVTKRLLLGFG